MLQSTTLIGLLYSVYVWFGHMNHPSTFLELVDSLPSNAKKQDTVSCGFCTKIEVHSAVMSVLHVSSYAMVYLSSGRSIVFMSGRS